MEELDKIEGKHKILINKAIEIMAKVPDPKHSTSHMESVVKYAKEILQYEKEANREVCIISAYWHDVGRSVKNEKHSLISADMLKEEMEKMGYDKELIEQCYLAIYKHSWYDMPETLEGIIVRDADKIDFVGINRWKQCINAKHKLTGIFELLPKLRNELLTLDSSRQIYDREVVELIKYLHNIIFK